ncbi:MAG TPA: cupredoxin domain-containing protein [Chloroflexota bacterium]|jgi:plastocyanin|nr:cupredoxin domain-containing protein [Chloroflexota bacterium]
MVNVLDNRFDPVTLEVPAGTLVRWTNSGSNDHDVVSTDFKTFESPLLKTGQTFEFTAAQAGQFPYVCTLHDGMTAILTVR